MKLDRFQEQEFDQHWTGTFLTDSKDILYCGEVIKKIDGKSIVRCRKAIATGLDDNYINIKSLDLEPVFIDTGFYQMDVKDTAFRISRLPVRQSKRGIGRKLLSVKYISFDWARDRVVEKAYSFDDVTLAVWLYKISRKENLPGNIETAMESANAGVCGIINSNLALLPPNNGMYPCIFDSCMIGYMDQEQTFYIHDTRKMFSDPVEQFTGKRVTIYA